MSYCLQIRKSSLWICANQMVKLGLLDPLRLTDSCSETSVTADLYCITSQKSKELICTMTET